MVEMVDAKVNSAGGIQVKKLSFWFKDLVKTITKAFQPLLAAIIDVIGPCAAPSKMRDTSAPINSNFFVKIGTKHLNTEIPMATTYM